MQPDDIITLYSEKYDIFGQVQDYGVLIKLCFSYKGREHEIGMARRPFKEELPDIGLRIMENTIEKLVSSPDGTFLHYWYIDGDEDSMTAHGVVTGHRRLSDTMKIHTSEIHDIQIDYDDEEAVLTTRNTVYRCPLSYCRFEKQDEYPELLPDYDSIREQYIGKRAVPEIEQGKVLLVLSGFSEYYFHSLCVRDEDDAVKPYRSRAHMGMFQDSYLIRTDDGSVDLCYFPHYGNIEFYGCETGGMPLYAENIGSSVIYIRLEGMTFSLKPGERKELSAENAEEDPGVLPDGNLYPAGVF